MGKYTTHIIFNQGLFHVVKNVLNDHCDRVLIIKRKLAVDSLLENTKTTEIEALEDISRMRWESDDLDSMDSKISECRFPHMNCTIIHQENRWFIGKPEI
jgi:hypothetical protein